MFISFLMLNSCIYIYICRHINIDRFFLNSDEPLKIWYANCKEKTAAYIDNSKFLVINHKLIHLELLLFFIIHDANVVKIWAIDA